MYLTIKKKMRDGNTYIDDKEKTFCYAYEKQEMEKVDG